EGLSLALVEHRLARHLHVAAERKPGDAVLGLAPAELEDRLAEAEGEDLHPDFVLLRHQEVAELVEEDDETEAQHHEHDAPAAAEPLGYLLHRASCLAQASAWRTSSSVGWATSACRSMTSLTVSKMRKNGISRFTNRST